MVAEFCWRLIHQPVQCSAGGGERLSQHRPRLPSKCLSDLLAPTIGEIKLIWRLLKQAGQRKNWPRVAASILGSYFLQEPTKPSISLRRKKRERAQMRRRGGGGEITARLAHARNYAASTAPIYFDWTWLLSAPGRPSHTPLTETGHGRANANTRRPSACCSSWFPPAGG